MMTSCSLLIGRVGRARNLELGMNLQNYYQKQATVGVFCLVVAATGLLAAPPAEEDPAVIERAFTQAGVKSAWHVQLPLQRIDAIKGLYLVEGNVYALANDGSVHCVRADNGQYRWLRKLAERGGTIWPPVAYREFYGEAVVFTLLENVVFLLPETGEEFLTYKLRESSVAASTVSRNTIYSAEVGHRIRNYNIEDKYQRWQIRRPGILRLPPVYLEPREILIFADDSGRVAGATGTDKVKEFETKVDGKPMGMAVGENTVYVATSENMLYQVSHRTGNILWKYYLPAAPTADPVVTEDHVYQAIDEGRILRIHKQRAEPERTFNGAKKFLAEWPERTVMLSVTDQVRIFSENEGQSRVLPGLDTLHFGIANTRNSAVLVGTKGGEIHCLLPAKRDTLVIDDFKSPRMPRPEPDQKPGTRPGRVKLIYPTTLFGPDRPPVEVSIEDLQGTETEQ
jgi:hypothetical protein